MNTAIGSGIALNARRHPLAWVVLLLAALAPASAKELLVGGSGTDLATVRLLAEAFSAERPDLDVRVLKSLGSGGGVKAVAGGRLHLGLTSRPLNAKELKYPISAHLYARTPLVVATRQGNPANDIESRVLFAAMSGEHQYWPDGLLMRLVLRPASDSDTLKLAQTFAPARQALDKAYRLRGVPVAQSDQDAADALESISGSVGLSSLAVIVAERRALKALNLDGVAPTLDNLASGAYPMGKELYLVLPADPDEDALHLARFIGSERGQQLLRKTGHLPVRLELD